MLKKLAQAIEDVVKMGGRLSDASFDFIERVLTEDVDEAQEWVTSAFRKLEEAWQKRVDDLEDVIDRLQERIDKLENPAEKATPAKKVSTTK